MNTRVITGLALCAIFSIASAFTFPSVISATSTNIAVYVFIASVIILFASLSAKATETNEPNNIEGELTTLYVGNLPYKANEEAVRTFFGQHVPVQSVRLMKDKKTGKRKGYGFIEITTKDVHNAIEQLNDIVFQDRTLKVRAAKEKVEG
jgi:RNA recognition motif-containing protein